MGLFDKKKKRDDGVEGVDWTWSEGYRTGIDRIGNKNTKWVQQRFKMPNGGEVWVQMCTECDGLGNVSDHALEPNVYGVIRITCPVCMGVGWLKYDFEYNWLPNYERKYI